MPVFKVDIEKQLGGEFWTNVYYVQTDTLGDGVTAGEAIVTAERSFHYGLVLFTKMRVSTAVSGDEDYVTVPLTGQGGADAGGAALLPLFNTVNAVLQAVAGRPSRKYYRGCLTVNNINQAGIIESRRAQIEAALDPLASSLGTSGAGLVDVDGQDIVSIAVLTPVGMHQLRRGTRRRQTPVLP